LGCGGRRNEASRQCQGGEDFCERLRYTSQCLSPAATPTKGGGLPRVQRKARARVWRYLRRVVAAKPAGYRLSLPGQGRTEEVRWSLSEA
jgi:hypothetical protein